MGQQKPQFHYKRLSDVRSSSVTLEHVEEPRASLKLPQNQHQNQLKSLILATKLQIVAFALKDLKLV